MPGMACFDRINFFPQNRALIAPTYRFRSQLLNAVWATTPESYEYNVNTQINRLRARIEAEPAHPAYVLTVRGVGYRFTDPG